MKKLQKGFIVPALMAIFVVITLGGGVYIWNENEKDKNRSINQIVFQKNKTNYSC